ncbi:hypothetical protein Hanom_Chr14g01300161 [Helianthus anomalus]
MRDLLRCLEVKEEVEHIGRRKERASEMMVAIDMTTIRRVGATDVIFLPIFFLFFWLLCVQDR